MTKFLTSFLRDETGAAAAEYALILAVVGSAIAIAAAALGTEIGLAIDDATAEITASRAL